MVERVSDKDEALGSIPSAPTDMANTKDDSNVEVNINLDTTPVLYTDQVFMSANEDGVVLDVGQKIGTSNQMRIVSRIGMSRSHAKKLVAALNDLLSQTDGRLQTRKIES